MGITLSNPNKIESLDNCVNNKYDLINWMCENIHVNAEYVKNFINKIKEEGIIIKHIEYTQHFRVNSINIYVILSDSDNIETELRAGFILKNVKKLI